MVICEENRKHLPPIYADHTHDSTCNDYTVTRSYFCHYLTIDKQKIIILNTMFSDMIKRFTFG